MANQEHIEWLLEGVDNWNQRRKDKYFRPDLSGENIYWKFKMAGMLDNDGFVPLSNINLGWANLREAIFSRRFNDAGADAGADLRHAKLKCADLKNAHLRNSRLDEADLDGAVLNGANLRGASFRGAKMSNARLYRTDLFDADLTNAELKSTCFKKANLSCATLHNVDLSSANLIGTELGWSRPWNAKLYDDSDSISSSCQDVRCGEQINCVADLIKRCNELYAKRSDAVLYFRGERTSEWELRPSVMRYSKEGNRPLYSNESKMLLDLMSCRPGISLTPLQLSTNGCWRNITG